jgi:hypothetical protein
MAAAVMELRFGVDAEGVLSKKSPSPCLPDGDRLSALQLMLRDIESASHCKTKGTEPRLLIAAQLGATPPPGGSPA